MGFSEIFASDNPNKVRSKLNAMLRELFTKSSGVRNAVDQLEVPTALADLEDDTTHRIVTDAQISDWNSGVGAGSNIDGGMANSNYGGTSGIDGGDA